MIPVTSFAGRKVAVFGLGASGLASASALLAGGADVVAFDDDGDKVTQANHAGIPTADLREIDWWRIAALVLSPGVPLTHPAPHWTVGLARAAGVEVIGDVELFCRERRRHAPQAPFVAITGTNGKSTTTALVAHVLATAGRDAQLGGNIGTAILSLDPPRSGGAYVVECSSYQIDLAPTLDPSIGILINLSKDHLDRHGSMPAYAAVKERLVAGVPVDGTAIVGVDDDWCRAIAERAEAAGKRVVRVSVRRQLADGLYVEADQIMRASGGAARAIALIGDIGSLRGLHNAHNAARAASAAQALACFRNIFWIAGGRPKAGGIASLEDFFPRIRKAYLIGEAAQEFAATLAGKVDHEILHSLDRAAAAAARDAEAAQLADAVVLLSPACASFDQFANFEARGDAFRALVRAM